MTDALTLTRRQLAELPALLARLGGFLRLGSGAVDPDMPRPPGRPLDTRSPLAVNVVDLAAHRKPDWATWRPGDHHARHGVAGTLWLWAYRARHDLALPAPTPAATPADLCQWLTINADVIVQRWPAFVTAIGRMHRDLERACGIRPEVTYHCPQCEWLIEPRDGKAWWVCTGCHRTWTSAAEIDRLLAEQADSCTLRQVAAEVGRPIGTLRRWKMDGWISPVGRRHGVAVYSLIAVRRVADSVRLGRPLIMRG